MFYLIVIGENGNLTEFTARQRAKPTALAINQMHADEVVELAIYGFDDDPREIWHIPEARDYFIAFVEEMLKHHVDLGRILPQSLMTVKACQAARAGKPVITTGTVEDTIREGVEQVMQRQRSQKP